MNMRKFNLAVFTFFLFSKALGADVEVIFEPINTVISGSLSPLSVAVDGQAVLQDTRSANKISINGNELPVTATAEKSFFYGTASDSLDIAAQGFKAVPIILPRVKVKSINKSDIDLEFSDVVRLEIDGREYKFRDNTLKWKIPSVTPSSVSVHIIVATGKSGFKRRYNLDLLSRSSVKLSAEEYELLKKGFWPTLMIRGRQANQIQSLKFNSEKPLGRRTKNMNATSVEVSGTLDDGELFVGTQKIALTNKTFKFSIPVTQKLSSFIFYNRKTNGMTEKESIKFFLPSWKAVADEEEQTQLLKFRVNGLGGFQNSGYYVSGELSWTPEVRLSSKYGVLLSLGASYFKGDNLVTNETTSFPLIDAGVLFSFSPNSLKPMGFELGGGAQSWVGFGTYPMVAGNVYYKKFFGFERFFMGYELVLAPLNTTHMFKVGVGFSL